jgi:hypothetical protein
MLSSTQNIS